MKKFAKIISGLLVTMPLVALAEDKVDTSYIESIIDDAGDLLNKIVVVLVAFAIVWFIYNVIRYTMSSDEDGKTKAKNQMIWGVIAIAVIVSIWGLVGILQNMAGTDTQSAEDVTKLLPSTK